MKREFHIPDDPRCNVSVARFPAPATRHPYRGGKGFTLLEVLVSMLVIGIVLPIIFSALSLIVTASADARKRTQATALAESKLQELTALQVLNVENGANSAGDFDHAPGFRWEAATSVQDVATEIDVRVSWDSKAGERSIDLSTYVYDSSDSTTSAGSAVTGGSK